MHANPNPNPNHNPANQMVALTLTVTLNPDKQQNDKNNTSQGAWLPAPSAMRSHLLLLLDFDRQLLVVSLGSHPAGEAPLVAGRLRPSLAPLSPGPLPVQHLLAVPLPVVYYVVGSVV